MEAPYQQRSLVYPLKQHQALPPIAALTDRLSPSEPSPGLPRQVIDTRDSGNWSVSQTSKREELPPPRHSSYGSAGLQLQSILNAEDSPSRTSMLSDGAPSTRTSLNPSVHSSNFTFDNRQSIDAVSLAQGSRRSSVDSRVNVGFGHLQISPSSPFQDQNASRASLVSTLQQQRGIASDRPISGGPLSPSARSSGLRVQNPPRRAPVISPNPRSVSGMPNPTAAAPTKGYAWAFPDENDELDNSSDSLSERGLPSRANSFAASVNSSVYTIDSQLPAGQKRFDEDQASTHHHSIQHRSVTSLQAGDLGLNGTSGNYSRTPELRVSHKMAERKRRFEMKGLFDELNNILPNSPGGKSSKWEILTKAIEHIKALRYQHDCAKRDVDRLRSEPDTRRRLEDENRMLQSELHAAWQMMHRMEPGKQHIVGQFTAQLEKDQPVHSAQPTQPHQQAQPAPPAAPQQNGWPQHNNNIAAMQGVEYAPTQAYTR